MQIFISCSHSNKKEVIEILKGFRDKNCQIWIDRRRYFRARVLIIKLCLVKTDQYILRFLPNQY